MFDGYAFPKAPVEPAYPTADGIRSQNYGWHSPSELDPQVGQLVFGESNRIVQVRGPATPPPMATFRSNGRPRSQSSTMQLHAHTSRGVPCERATTSHSRRIQTLRGRAFLDPAWTVEQNRLISHYKEKAAESDNLRIELEVLNRTKGIIPESQQTLASSELDGESKDLEKSNKQLKDYVKKLVEQNEHYGERAERAEEDARVQQKNIKHVQLELGQTKFALVTVTKEKEEVVAQREDFKDRNELLRSSHVLIEKEFNILSGEINGYKTQIAEFSSKLDDEEIARTRAESKLKATQGKLRNQQHEFATTQTQLRTSEKDVAGLRLQCDELFSQASRLSSSVLALETGKINSVSEIASLQAGLNKLEETKVQTAHQLTSLKLELDGTKSKLKETIQYRNDQLDGLDAQIKKLTRENKEAAELHANNKGHIDRLTAELGDIQDELAVVVQDKKQLESDLGQAKNDITGYCQENSLLSNQRKQQDIELSNMGKQLPTMQAAVDKLTCDNAKQAKDTYKVKMALKEHIEKLAATSHTLEEVQKEHADSANIINNLKDQCEQKDTQISSQLDLITKLKREVETQTAEIKVHVDTQTTMLQRIATQEQQLRVYEIELQNFVRVKAEKEMYQARSLQQEAELKEKKACLEELSKNLKAITTGRDYLQKVTEAKAKSLEAIQNKLEQEMKRCQAVTDMVQQRDKDIVKYKKDYQELRIKNITLKSALNQQVKAGGGEDSITDPEVMQLRYGDSITGLKFLIKDKDLQIDLFKQKVEVMALSTHQEIATNNGVIRAKEELWEKERFKLDNEIAELKDRVHLMRTDLVAEEQKLKLETQRLSEVHTSNDKLRTQLNLTNLQKVAIWDERLKQQETITNDAKDKIIEIKASYDAMKAEVEGLKKWQLHITTIYGTLQRLQKLKGMTGPATKEQLIEIIKTNDNFFRSLIKNPGTISSEPEIPISENTDEDDIKIHMRKLSSDCDQAIRKEALAREELEQLRRDNAQLILQCEQSKDRLALLTSLTKDVQVRDSAVQQSQERLRSMQADAGIVFEDDNKVKYGGICVKAVQPDQPAEVVGIMRNDIIIEVDGHKIETGRDYRDALLLIRPGQVVAFILLRNTVRHVYFVKMSGTGYTREQTEASFRLAWHYETDFTMDFAMQTNT